MSSSSDLLGRLLQTKRSATDVQVVFTDIVKYSRRKTVVQRRVIEKFTQTAVRALGSVTRGQRGGAVNHSLNLATDIIKIPTGDGLAVIVPPGGPLTFHVRLAEKLVTLAHNANHSKPCEKFESQGWCNCHDSFTLRCGISEGKAILYKDINGNYNVAGRPVNEAARIMDLGDGMQILFSELACRNLIEISEKYSEDDFRLFSDVEVKHGIKLDVYQYCPARSLAVDTNEPSRLSQSAGSLSP